MGTTAISMVPDQDAAGEQPRPLDPVEVGIFVRTRREFNGWSQETLAEISRLSVRTVQRVEDGQPSSIDTRRALARAFEFEDIDFLSRPMPVPDEVQVRRLMEECRRLHAEKERAEAHMTRLNQQTENVQMMLNMAAARDARWLHMVRTTLMPKQPGRVPFHHSVEVALRGYKVSMTGKPTLLVATWSKLPREEGGLSRGYDAGLVLTGGDFAPGITYAHRFKGAPENGAPDFSNIWRQPSIYFGDRLEVSTGTDGDDGPVSWMGMEFAVRSPEGHVSDWVDFSFGFDDEKLLESMPRLRLEGERLLACNEAGAAVEPLRRAWLLSRAVFGWGSVEYELHEAIWKRALDQSRLDKLSFRKGACLRIIRGPHKGKSGKVEKLMLGHYHAYVIDAGVEQVQVSEDDVEAI